MNWLWIQNGMKSSHKILNKFTENWFLFAKNLCIFCNDLWYVDYIGRTRYNCLYSPLASRSDNWLRNPHCHEIFVSNLIDQLSLKVLLFALVLQFYWTRKLFDMTLIPYLDGTRNFYLFILVAYRPIKNLSNVMLLKHILNARSVTGQLKMNVIVSIDPWGTSGAYQSMMSRGLLTVLTNISTSFFSK